MKTFVISALLPVILLLAPPVHADPASTHGMLIFGTEKVYLSHLPMFHSPHDYQVIFEVSLEGSAKSTFFQHQKDHPETPFYTLVPERFVLPDMVASPRPFKAEIVAGHFERPGHESLVEETTVTITKVIHFSKLSPQTTAPAKLPYFAFGSNAEIFVAHVIAGRPDFDHILKVQLNSAAAKAQINEKGIVKLEFPSLPNRRPLRAQATAQVAEGGPTTDVAIVRDLYLEFGDLEH